MKRLFPPLLLILCLSPHAQAQSGRFLVPIAQTNVNGAQGSLWVTELYAHNHSDEVVWISNNVSCQWSAEHACDQDVPARSSVSVGLSFEPYMFHGVTKERDIGKVTFSAYVRNVSGTVQSWGTALPVPDVATFRPSPLRISPVPADPEYRVSLRLYTFSEEVASVDVEIWLLDGGLREVNRLGTLSVLPLYEGEYKRYGSSFEVHDLLGRISGMDPTSRVAIKVLAPPSHDSNRWWGFATVTHNTSQQVTVFAP